MVSSQRLLVVLSRHHGVLLIAFALVTLAVLLALGALALRVGAVGQRLERLAVDASGACACGTLQVAQGMQVSVLVVVIIVILLIAVLVLQSVLLRNLILEALVEFLHLAGPGRGDPLPPRLLLDLADTLLLRAVLVLRAHLPQLVVHGEVHLHPRIAVQALVRVALGLVVAVALSARVLRVAVELGGVQVPVLVLECFHAPPASLEELGLVLTVLGDAQAHLPPPLLLLLPLHGLLHLALILLPALLHHLCEVALDLLVLAVLFILIIVGVGVAILPLRVSRRLLDLGTAIVIEELIDGLVHVFLKRPLGSHLRHLILILVLLLVLLLRRGLLLLLLGSVLALGLLRRPVELLALPANLHAPLQQVAQVLLAADLQVGACLSDVLVGEEMSVQVLRAWRFEVDLVVRHEDLRRVRRIDELVRRDDLVQVAILVTATVLLRRRLQEVGEGRALLLVLVLGLCRGHRDGVQGLHEDVLRLEELGVELSGLEAGADHENLCGDVTRGCGLRGIDLLEELAEDPHQRVVVGGAEDLGDEGATWSEVLARQLQRVQCELILHVSILRPRGTDVGRAVVQHDIGISALQLLLQEVAALLGGDVRLYAGHAVDGLDRRQVYSDDL
mmetsp:Transcript_60321/g.155412  ORF Transcript_60321/g.155412 Transcript_60321/m.155412 type:complete len:619 (+) Transcript_60321:1041-2897(+)